MDTVFVHKMWDEQEISKITGKKTPFPLLNHNCACIGKATASLAKKKAWIYVVGSLLTLKE